MNQIAKKILILSGGLFLFLFLFVKTTLAVDCNPYPPLSGTYTITTTPSCSFAGTPNGADNGGITISTGVNLIIPANATVAWTSGQSVTIQGTGSISINATGAQLKKTNLWMVDADGDGWPGTSTQTAQDTSPGGTYVRRYTLNAGSFNTSTGAWTLDCNDNSFSTSNSCCVASTWYQDADGDGYGNPSVSQSACSQPAGYVADNTDCDDGNANAHPGQTSYFTTARSNGSFDYNCDGSITANPAHQPTSSTTYECFAVEYGSCRDQNITNTRWDVIAATNAICGTVHSYTSTASQGYCAAAGCGGVTASPNLGTITIDCH